MGAWPCVSYIHIICGTKEAFHPLKTVVFTHCSSSSESALSRQEARSARVFTCDCCHQFSAARTQVGGAGVARGCGLVVVDRLGL